MSALFRDRDAADAAAEKLKVFAQPQRLMILSCLLRGERTVADVGTATAIAQPALSQQLAALRRAGLVVPRKVAKQVFYSLADDGAALCVGTMEAILSGDVPAAAGQHVAVSPTDAPSGAAGFARVV